MRQGMGEFCNRMSSKTEASLVAIAESSSDSQAIVWVYADRPLNDRYTRMTVSYGKGVAGRVMQTGTPFLCEDIDALPSPLKEYPIVLSEKLQAFAALPIATNSLFGAVLLIGYRSKHPLPNRQTCNHLIRSTAQFLNESLC